MALSGKGPFTVGDIVGQTVFAVRAHGGLEETPVPVAAVLRPDSGTPAFPWERLLDCARPRAASNNLSGTDPSMPWVVCVTIGAIPTSPVPLPTPRTPPTHTGEVAAPATPPVQDSQFGSGASDSTDDSGSFGTGTSDSEFGTGASDY